MIRPALALSLLASAPALAQSAPAVYGIRSNGDLIRIDPITGAGTFVASTGLQVQAADSVHEDSRVGSADYLLVAGGPGPSADQILCVSLGGDVSVYKQTSGRPQGYAVRGLSYRPNSVHVVLRDEAGLAADLLAHIGWNGTYTVIGPTGRADLEGLSESPDGVLYAVGTGDGGRLYSLDQSTGLATPIGGGFGADAPPTSLEFMHDGRLLACSANLVRIDPATGTSTTVGATGFDDIRGMGAISACYANCATGGPSPLLNVTDFTCFLQLFQFGHPYANCDMSTTEPVLNVADFTCFLQAIATGCN